MNIEGNVGVVSLQYGASGSLTSAALVGQISTGGNSIANVTLSPDGRRLYVTSEIKQPGVAISGTNKTTLAHDNCTDGSDEEDGTGAAATPTPSSTYGILSVIDVQKAEAHPNASSIIVTEAAGCRPVRVVETADQQVIWVAARGDNSVLAFSTHALESTPDNALLGAVKTGGMAPVGLQLFHNGQLLAVANSNRFSNPVPGGAPTVAGNVAILNATPVNPSVVQIIPAFLFPRSVSVAPDDSTLFVANFTSGIIQTVTTAVQ